MFRPFSIILYKIVIKVTTRSYRTFYPQINHPAHKNPEIIKMTKINDHKNLRPLGNFKLGP